MQINSAYPSLKTLPTGRPDPRPAEVLDVFDHQGYQRDGVLVELLPQHRYRVTGAEGSVVLDPTAKLAYAAGMATALATGVDAPCITLALRLESSG